jgi:predicted DNA-binding protein with PD1-like motif
MKYSEARQGRIFVIRLEDGEILHEEIERFSSERGIRAAALIVVGGADKGSTLVVGPEEARATPVVPIEHRLKDVYEVLGSGTIFPNEAGQPILHMHTACGRKSSSVTGCVRAGVRVWNVMEVILIELLDTTGLRQYDPVTGFDLLNP